MSEIIVALVGAGGVVLATWWSQPGRKAVGIQRYAELLTKLPEESGQRERLAAEIDKMVGRELDDRRLSEVMSVIWAIFVFLMVAIVATSMARTSGGIWWPVAIEFWAMTVATTVMLPLGAWLRRKRRAA